MKQCPECNELFDDQKAFCDIDGSALSSASVPSSGNSSAWVTGAIGGLIGVIICVLLYMLFVLPGRQNDLEQDRRAAQTKEPTTVQPSRAALVPANNQVAATEPSPTETESPAEEAASPSPAAPAAAPPPAALNNGPIATGTTRDPAGGDHAIIKMKDGSTVEADAAWEDAQGVWYRRSGLVSFVEKSRVEAITEPQRKATESKTP